MISFSTLAIALAGLLIGMILGLTGGGGSILTVPLLVYGLHLDTKVAIATSLLIVGLTSLAGLYVHSRAGNIRWATGGIFGAAGMVGAYAGGSVAQFLADFFQLLLFASVMIGSGVAMLRQRCAPSAAPSPRARHWLRVTSDGVICGGVTGLVGAGGGFLIVPALALLGGMPMHMAVGTSLLVIAMNCFSALAGYVLHSHVDIELHVAAVITLCAIAGTVAGTRVARAVPAARLQQMFGVFVLVVAAILIVTEGSAAIARALVVERTAVAAALAGIGGAILIPWVIRLLHIGPTAAAEKCVAPDLDRRL